VPHQFLHCLQVYTSHNQAASKGVAEPGQTHLISPADGAGSCYPIQL
jgi:hypothetical protein